MGCCGSSPPKEEYESQVSKETQSQEPTIKSNSEIGKKTVVAVHLGNELKTKPKHTRGNNNTAAAAANSYRGTHEYQTKVNNVKNLWIQREQQEKTQTTPSKPRTQSNAVKPMQSKFNNDNTNKTNPSNVQTREMRSQTGYAGDSKRDQIFQKSQNDKTMKISVSKPKGKETNNNKNLNANNLGAAEVSRNSFQYSASVENTIDYSHEPVPGLENVESGKNTLRDVTPAPQTIEEAPTPPMSPGTGDPTLSPGVSTANTAILQQRMKQFSSPNENKSNLKTDFRKAELIKTHPSIANLESFEKRMSGFSQGLQKARKETDRRASAYKDERREDDVPIDEEQKRRASTLLKEYASVKAAEAADIRLVDETLKNISKKNMHSSFKKSKHSHT